MKYPKILLFLSVAFFFLGCKKEKVENKGLDPTIENVVGTWTLQQVEIYFTNNNGEVIPGGGITAEQPNTQVYTLREDLSFNLAVTLTNGSGDVYNSTGSYKIVESSFNAKMVKHFNFNNSQQINNIIRYIDSDKLELYTAKDNNGSGQHTVEYYARIR